LVPCSRFDKLKDKNGDRQDFFDYGQSLTKCLVYPGGCPRIAKIIEMRDMGEGRGE
jgi:hypothetical protein